MGKANVSTAKPKIGGAVYMAPAGTSVPTDASTALATGFISLGYISEDGLQNSNGPESSEVKAWGGDVVIKEATGRNDEFNFTLLEVMDPNVLKLVYGEDNVSGTLATGIAVEVGNHDLEQHAFVVEMIGKGGALHRICIPDAKVTAVGDVSYTDSNASGYAVTISADADTDGNTHYEYWKKS